MKQATRKWHSQACLVCSLVCGFALVNSDQSLAANWGAQTYVWAFDATSYWRWGTSDSDGGAEHFRSESAVEDLSRGHARASAELQGWNLMPILKAEAYHTSSTSDGAYAWALGVEGFTYDGDTPYTYTIESQLTGDVYKPDGSKDYNGIFAHTYVLNEENFFYHQDIYTLVGEEGVVPKGFFELALDETVTGGFATGSTSFSVEPGETFYIHTFVEVKAVWNNASASSYSTFLTRFDSTEGLENLTPLSIETVPVPGGVWLLGSGLLCLFGIKRKLKR